MAGCARTARDYAPGVIRGILLDFYGTVVEDDDATMVAVADHVAAHATRPVTGAQVLAAWTAEYAAVADGTPFRTLRECARRSLATVMADVGCPGDAADVQADFAPDALPPLRPGTREFLAEVALPICVVSDADRVTLDAAIAHHGLRFTAVVCSEDVGAYKPAAIMFTSALTALGLAAHEVVHVGDSLRTDMAGARALGIRTAWVDRHGRPPTDGAADHVVDDLRDLFRYEGAAVPRRATQPGVPARP